jgi:hypothetical protein
MVAADCHLLYHPKNSALATLSTHGQPKYSKPGAETYNKMMLNLSCELSGKIEFWGPVNLPEPARSQSLNQFAYIEDQVVFGNEVDCTCTKINSIEHMCELRINEKATTTQFVP